MEDVQSRTDHRGIALHRAGIAGVRLPVVAMEQRTVALAELAVSVEADTKGAHMSRFLQALEPHRELLSLARMPALLKAVRETLEASSASVRFVFPYFFEKAAPVSGAKGWSDIEASLAGSIESGSCEVWLGASIPVTSLCPCSRAISDYGAHNQRGTVHIEVRPRRSGDQLAPISLADLVAVAEAAASAPVYPVLKRPDERHVTMQAYDNPVFVEDMARDVAGALREDPRVVAFHVRVVNEESIHNHQAFASVSWVRDE